MQGMSVQRKARDFGRIGRMFAPAETAAGRPPLRPMAHEFKQRRRIEFYETDLAGIVHFSNFFRFMESAEHAFFRSLGLSLHREEKGHVFGFARVRATCDYRYPARYQDLLEVRLRVIKKTASSFTYSFSFHTVDEAKDAVEGRELAFGELKVVCVSKGPEDERLRTTDMPREIAEAVEVAPEGT